MTSLLIDKGKKTRENLWNLPNSLTFIRIGFIPVLFFLLFFPGPLGSLAAGLAFGAASLTDWLDGYLARRHGWTTLAGRFLDPIADKLLITVPLIMLIPLERVPAWMVAIVLAREIGITGLRGIASAEGLSLPSSSLAKYKTTFQAAAIIGLLLHYEYLSIDFHAVGMVFFIVALVLTLWSGMGYLIKFYRYHLRP